MIHLLAEADDPVKFIFFGVVAFIWIVRSLVSAAAKKREEARRLRVRESIQSDRILPPQLPIPQQIELPTPRAAPMLRRIDTPQRQKPRPVPVPAQKKQKSRRKSSGSPPIRLPQPPTAVAPVPTRTSLESASPAASPSAVTHPASASATTLKSWLKPATLRQQFILTEVFQPPISLR